MKKIIIGILSLIYLTVTSGVVISMHYCMGKIADVEYAYRTNNKCDKCGMENKQGCCHTEYKIVKLSDDQQQVKASSGFNQQLTPVIHYTFSLLQPLQGLEKNQPLVIYSPPDNRQIPLYLSQSIFRI